MARVELGQSNSILLNPWRNAYWFMRMLINSDKYGAIGKDNRLMNMLAKGMQSILEQTTVSATDRLALCKAYMHSTFQDYFTKKTGRSQRIELLLQDISHKLITEDDINVFILSVQNLLVPINIAMTTIPNDDRIFTVNLAKTYLDELGEQGLATVINMWDDAGVEGCLNAEREAVVQGFTHLRRDLEHLCDMDANIVLTAFVQEFERRLGQKRKGRAGGSLEDVASFLFDYYGLKATHQPEHFQADIEIDKWIRCNDKWLIGISCKRTLRERWKQVSSANSDILSKFKIKQIWHLITYDEDLSDDKVTLLGGQRHIFYLPDNSRRLQYIRQHLGMTNYVRPMSEFIKNIKQEQGISSC
jgi:hypothetical protein